MVSAERIFVCFLVACFHYCAANSTALRVDFEDCGIYELNLEKWYEWNIFEIFYSGSVLEPYRVYLGTCYNVPCRVERGQVIDIEVEFNPNGKFKIYK